MNAWSAMLLPSSRLSLRRNPGRLLQDLQRVTFLQLHAGGAQDGADRTRRPSLFADDLAQVVWGDAQFEDGVLFPSSAFTCTCSGSSTSALAISSTSNRMSPPGSFAILRLLHCGGPMPWFAPTGPIMPLPGARRSFFEQTDEGGRELRALRTPVVDAVTLHFEARRVGARVVSPHHFDGASVTGAFLVDHHHAVIRLLARPKRAIRIINTEMFPFSLFPESSPGMGTNIDYRVNGCSWQVKAGWQE